MALALSHPLPQRRERLLQLLVGHCLEDIAVLNLEFLGNQQSTDFHVRRRLRLAHLLDGLWAVALEIGREREQEIPVERSTRSLQGTARVCLGRCPCSEAAACPRICLG